MFGVQQPDGGLAAPPGSEESLADVYRDPYHPSQVEDVTLLVVEQVFSVYLPLTIQ